MYVSIAADNGKAGNVEEAYRKGHNSVTVAKLHSAMVTERWELVHCENSTRVGTCPGIPPLLHAEHYTTSAPCPKDVIAHGNLLEGGSGYAQHGITVT